jgi:hypothetical protein
MRENNASFQPVGHAPVRFAVDDVEASSEQLRTEELIDVMRVKIERKVLLAPAGRPCVVESDTGCSHSLVAAVHVAFSRHLPLTLSPDAIWLTILQGFSHHVNANAEKLRHRLVRHEGRVTLEQKICAITTAPVQTAVSGICRQIRDATDPVLYESLVSDFSTTTPDARTASEIALMDTYSAYFDFMMKCVCGIPQITIEGNVEDWQRIRGRVEVLATFGLEWWVDRLRPILDEFVHAAEGRPDREFWRTIYKFRAGKNYYDPDKVTGWLVDLFPYLGDPPHRHRPPAFDLGKSRELRSSDFPSGVCSVDVGLEIQDELRGTIERHKLALVAGMMGVEQNREDAGVSPVISWCLANRG